MSKGKLNIYRDNFLEKEELSRLMSFISDNPALFLFVSNAQSFGILQQGTSLSNDPAFKVEVGTNSNTIKIAADSYALDENGNIIYQRLFDNLPVPTDSTYYWVKISHRYDNYEMGWVDIASDGTLSGSDTAFTEVLRGSSSGFPVKVKFYTQSDDGTLTAATNSGIYEVVSVVSDNTAVISGNLTTESHLRYVVLGTFSIKTSIAAITSTGIYSYDSCQIDFIEEEVTDTPPVTDFVEGEEFYIARIICDGVTVTVENKRTNYYFRLNFGDIIVSNKANIDASDLSGADITAWLTKLSVYTQSQIISYLSGKADIAAGNLTTGNVSTWLAKLSVYTKAEIDAMTDNSGKANIDASNLSAGNITAWLTKLAIYTSAQVDALIALGLTKANNLSDLANAVTACTNLDVYQKAAVDALVALRLLKANNLSDLADTPTARTNLSVYSKTEQGDLLRKTLNIGDWNMDADLSVSVAHGLTLTKIRSIKVTIRIDTDDYYYDISYFDLIQGKASGFFVIDTTNIILYRVVGCAFDNTNFDSTSYNRGFIVIDYIA